MIKFKRAGGGVKGYSLLHEGRIYRKKLTGRLLVAEVSCDLLHKLCIPKKIRIDL